MTVTPRPASPVMRAVRYHDHGGAEVLQLDEVPIPEPGSGRIRVAVYACALNPADAAYHLGLFGGPLPGGIGIDVSGVVDAVGPDVSGVEVGDRVFGATAAGTDYGAPTGGAADFAVLGAWAHLPDGLDLLRAAALPLVAETAFRGLTSLDVEPGQVIVVNGGGSVVGEAAVHIAHDLGIRVVATAGPARAAALRDRGALVTDYGPGMVQRVRDLAGAPIDRALDVSPAGSGSIAALVKLTGDPDHVLTLTDFAAPDAHGIRVSGVEAVLRWDALPRLGAMAATGRLAVPISRTFPLNDFRAAVDLAESGRPGGKVMLTVLNDQRR